MYSWIFGEYFYKSYLMKIIDEIEIKRKVNKNKGLQIKSSFAMDLKDRLNNVVVLESIDRRKSESDLSTDL